VNADITPRTHHDGEVSLLLKLEISKIEPIRPPPATPPVQNPQQGPERPQSPPPWTAEGGDR
jgi:hypothetical protein